MSELGDKLSQHFNPSGYAVMSAKGVDDGVRRVAAGSDSTMIVFQDTDGYNSMRALTFDEIVQALEEIRNAE